MCYIFLFYFFYNFNQLLEFTFYKLMLWLLQCLDGESSSGESPVPQIRSIGQFLLSRLFSSLNSSFLRSGFSWVSSLVWCLLHFWWITSCTYDIPRSACMRPFLWSSDQSSWLQIQRSGFDFRRYQIFWEVVGLERVHSASWLQLRSCLEEQVAAPIYKTEVTAVGICHADHTTPSILKSWH
jgi:hypothetical protein